MTPAAYAVVNRNAAQHNLAVVRSLAPNAKIMAVVKANGYGHGLVRIAEALREADAFAVARVDEGVRLRNAGFDHRIAVLEGFTCAEELELLLQHGLDAVVHSQAQLDILEACAEDGLCSAWLKLDTGMNRLGFSVREFNEAYRRLSRCAHVRQPVNLMTHFSDADEIDNDKTAAQIDLFERTVAGLPGERSLANSAGILGWKRSLSDWVRPGVMLYGISPFPDRTGPELDLQPVMTLQSRLIAVKRIEAGQTVGYGSSWTAIQPTKLGVIAIGYGDGYPRHAKPGTPVLVNGRRVPLVGRVSMDMITVDLGSESDDRLGDPVILWGEHLPVEEIARCADTIPYTLVCTVTQRVQVIEK
ncbi:MAG: alanine racemase [Methylobacter sp.]